MDWWNNSDPGDENDFDPMRDLEELYKEMDKLPSERPIFSDKQVLSFEDLEIGKMYAFRIYKELSVLLCVVVSDPFPCPDIEGSWRISVRSTLSNRIYDVSLRDQSVMPYSNGKWNDTNYIEVIE